MSNIAFATLMILLVLPVYYLAVIAHELGHVVAGWCVGYRMYACGTGMGNPLIQFRMLGIVWFVGRIRPTGGLTIAVYPSLSVPRWRQGVLCLGGAVANLLILAGSIVLFSYLPSSQDRWVVGLFAFINACTAYSSLLPTETRAGPLRLSSDGRQLLALLIGRERNRLTASLNGVRGMLELATQLKIGPVMHYQNLWGALIWCEIGSAARARELFDRARSLPPDREHATVTSLLVTVQSRLLAMENRVEESILAAQLASRGFQLEGDWTGNFLVNSYLAMTSLSISDVESAERFVAQAEADISHNKQFHYFSQAIQRMIRVIRGELGSGDDFVEWFARLPVSIRDPAWAMESYQFLGQYFAERGEPFEAERWLTSAVRMATKVSKGFVYQDDRDAFESVSAHLTAQLENVRARGSVSSQLAVAVCDEGGELNDSNSVEETEIDFELRQRRRWRQGWKLTFGLLFSVAISGATHWWLTTVVLPAEQPSLRRSICAPFFFSGLFWLLIPLLAGTAMSIIRPLHRSSARNYGTLLLTSAIAAWIATSLMTGALLSMLSKNG